MRPRATLVIIAYNEEHQIPVLLESIRRQRCDNVETLLIDSNSTDRTREVATRIGARIPGFHLHHMVRRGIARGRNTGARRAASDLIIFLDADVKLPRGFVNATIDEFRRRGLGCAAVPVRADSRRFIDQIPYLFISAWFRITQTWYPHCVGSCIVAKKSVHAAIKGFDPTIRLAEDNDYINRARNVGTIGVLHHPHLVSARRFHTEGFVALTLKYILVFFYRITKGEIRDDSFKYRFAHYGTRT